MCALTDKSAVTGGPVSHRRGLSNPTLQVYDLSIGTSIPCGGALVPTLKRGRKRGIDTMHTIITDANTITLQYTDSRTNSPVKLSADLSKYAKLFDVATTLHDDKKVVDKRNFDRVDLRIYHACGENLYEALGQYFFGLVRGESPSQDAVRKALQDYLNLWHMDWVADNRFVMMILPFVGAYRTEKNTYVTDSGEWVEEVHKVFKQSATANTFMTNVERMLVDAVNGGVVRTFTELREAKRAKAEAKKAAKKAAAEAEAAKNAQA